MFSRTVCSTNKIFLRSHWSNSSLVNSTLLRSTSVVTPTIFKERNSDKNIHNFTKYESRTIHTNSAEANTDKKVLWKSLSGALLAIAFGTYVGWEHRNRNHLLAKKRNISLCEEPIANLPTFRRNDVAKHYETSTKIWVSFNRGVYDITDFVAKHPGGSRIMMAAGGSLEPFWELYPVHTGQHIFDILEKYRIGNLAEEDILEADETCDKFSGEPTRHPSLMPRSSKPFNGETPPDLLTGSFYTPNELFYVRNHLPVPDVDVKTYTLEISGLNIPTEKSLCVAEIKKFPKVEISATIQCGGNRRTEMGKSKPVAGLGWTGGAIGNAKWGGARLKDVLQAAGFNISDYKNPENIHVQFEGLDSDPSGESYGASVPLSYILDGNFEAILAYEMNGKCIPVDHGFPLRIILPGIVGARSVKWLSRIIISDTECQSPWQQRDYKIFSPSVTMETVDFSSSPPIQDTPVTSYICSHSSGQVVKNGPLQLKGYAFSGGGRKIVRVEISKDLGKTWEIANIVNKDDTTNKTRNWSWVHWEGKINLDKGAKEIWVKAVDSGYNQQPEDVNGIWNYRGLLSTAYHKVSLIVH